MRVPWKTIICTGALLFVAGCATPESRIRKNPELFNSFPLDVQANVRKGQIDIGFTKEMVTMALGKPDYIYLRRTESGTTEVWSYVASRYWSEPYPAESTFLVPDTNGKYHYVSIPTWIDVRREYEYEKLRIEFDDSKVKAIEDLK